MKHKTFGLLTWIAVLTLALGLMGFTPARPAAPAPQAQSPDGDQVVFGENYSLKEGDTLDGSLVVLGGNADLEQDSTVTGDVVILGGNLQAGGVIRGDVTVVGGSVTLAGTALVKGDVNSLGGSLAREEGATIEGQVTNNVRLPFLFGAPAAIRIPNWQGDLPGPTTIPGPTTVDMGIGLIGKFLWWLGRSLIWALLALLALLFVPRHVERIAAAATSNPVPSGGLGLLTAIVAPLLLGLLVLTICGIPITLVGALLMFVAWALGIIALGLETGARLERMVNMDWAPTFQAAVGTFFLTLVANGIGWLVPCVGWLVPFMIGIVGFGAALLTRFGSQVYPPAGGMAAYTPPPAAYTPPPAASGGAQVYDESSDNV